MHIVKINFTELFLEIIIYWIYIFTEIIIWKVFILLHVFPNL